MHCWANGEYVANATDVHRERRAILRSVAVVVPFLSEDADRLGLPVKATVTPPKQPLIASSHSRNIAGPMRMRYIYCNGRCRKRYMESKRWQTANL
jgi:hypothetical protein